MTSIIATLFKKLHKINVFEWSYQGWYVCNTTDIKCINLVSAKQNI